jgi:transcriptional regulator with XRE-family HTH domain
MIGEHMRRLRKEKGWTLKTLAEKCGVSTNTAWRWEQGKQIPTIDLLERAAAELKTDVNYLLGRQDNPLPYIVGGEEAGTLMAQEEVGPGHIIIVPYLELPEVLENLDKPPSFYKRYDLSIPTISIGKLPTDGYPFFFRAHGDAMAGAGLRDGSMALVNPSENCQNGDLVLAFVGPRLEVTARWCYWLPGDIIELRCASPDYPVFRFQCGKDWETPPELNIRGKIVGAWNSSFNSSLKRGV